MIKFVYEPGISHAPHTAVERLELVISEDASVDEILESTKHFIMAVGYPLSWRDEISWKKHEDPAETNLAAEESLEDKMLDPDYVGNEYETCMKKNHCTACSCEKEVE